MNYGVGLYEYDQPAADHSFASSSRIDLCGLDVDVTLSNRVDA